MTPKAKLALCNEGKEADPKIGREALLKLLSDVREGREGSRRELQKRFDEYPILAGPFGNQAQLAEMTLVTVAAGGDPVREESMRRWLADMRQGLEKPGDGELERLLIQQLVLSWFALNHGEQRRAMGWNQGRTLAEATFWDRRVSRLNADFQKAGRNLAEVRRLARPTVLAQMNIADKQQINIAAVPQPIAAADAE